MKVKIQGVIESEDGRVQDVEEVTRVQISDLGTPHALKTLHMAQG